jgi:hypothetical protein
MLDMHEVIGSIPIVSTKRKTDVIDVRFSFGDDLLIETTRAKREFGSHSRRRA